MGIVSLIAAGCPSAVPKLGVQRPSSVAAKQGFGKLPKLGDGASAEQVANPSAAYTRTAPSAPLALKDQAVGSAPSAGGVAMPSSPTMIRPIPYPYPYPQPHPVTVEYLLEGTMPSWGSEGEVARSAVLQTDPSTLAAIGSRIGVPAAVLNGATKFTSFNAQWQDADQIQWGLDSGSNALSFWKNVPYQEPNGKTFPTFSKEEITGIAKAFLLAHGFTSVAAQTPDIQEWPQILPMMGKPMQADGAGMPCRYMEGATYPYPCGGWMTQVTLIYPAMHDGKKVTDAYGNPASNATITITLSSKEVTNGYVQLDGSTDRSSYPLIDAETAKRRLQSGGRNPVYAYGEKNIVVHLKTLEVVWMRYDSWKDSAHETYDLPALLATGTVDRGIKNQPPEDYRTLVPLLKDDVFSVDEGNVPYPILYGGSGGGAVQIMPAPAPTPPAPKKK